MQTAICLFPLWIIVNGQSADRKTPQGKYSMSQVCKRPPGCSPQILAKGFTDGCKNGEK